MMTAAAARADPLRWRRRFARTLIYFWTAPNTLLGLALAAIGWVSGGRARLVQGVIEAHGPGIRWMLRHLVPLPGGASAMTFGHVVIARDADCLDRSRAHERVHVRQYERWGPLFIPVYLLASLFLLLRRRDPYHDNPFEREAYGRSTN